MRDGFEKIFSSVSEFGNLRYGYCAYKCNSERHL